MTSMTKQQGIPRFLLLIALLLIMSPAENYGSGLVNRFLFEGEYGVVNVKEVAADIVRTSDCGYAIVGGSNDATHTAANTGLTVIKLDQQGNSVWYKKFGHLDGFDEGKDIIETSDDNLVVCGYNSTDGTSLVVKLNGTTGALIWDELIRCPNTPNGCVGNVKVEQIEEDESGDIIGVGIGSHFYLFLCRINGSTGSLTWGTSHAATTPTSPPDLGIALELQGADIYVVGRSSRIPPPPDQTPSREEVTLLHFNGSGVFQSGTLFALGGITADIDATPHDFWLNSDGDAIIRVC